jgi:hypothetical protein
MNLCFSFFISIGFLTGFTIPPLRSYMLYGGAYNSCKINYRWYGGNPFSVHGPAGAITEQDHAFMDYTTLAGYGKV